MHGAPRVVTAALATHSNTVHGTWVFERPYHRHKLRHPGCAEASRPVSSVCCSMAYMDARQCPIEGTTQQVQGSLTVSPDRTSTELVEILLTSNGSTSRNAVGHNNNRHGILARDLDRKDLTPKISQRNNVYKYTHSTWRSVCLSAVFCRSPYGKKCVQGPPG